MQHADQMQTLKSFAEKTVGPLRQLEDVSRKFGSKSVVWKLESDRGQAFYLKKHEHYSHYKAEVRVLRQWIPALPTELWWETPQVVSFSDELGALVLIGLPGVTLDSGPANADTEVRAHRLAGKFAGELHTLNIEKSREPRTQDYSRKVIDQVFGVASIYLDAETLAWAESVVSEPGVWDSLQIVPVHCDYSPRNWLVNGDRPRLGIIDWERARLGYWVEDFQRQTYEYWAGKPWLKDAFFEGYGREPTAKEWRQANLVTLINAISGVPWARDHGDSRFEQHNRITIESLKAIL